MDMDILVISLIIRCICGGIACAIASGKGRSTGGWFFGGFFLGIIGIVIVACISDLKAEQARHQRAAVERRRLREKLKQERMKSEGFRKHTVKRLDAHDRRLGVNTRRPRRLGTTRQRRRLPQGPAARSGSEVASGTASAPRTNPVGASRQDTSLWYYEVNGETMGPVAQGAIQRMLQTGKLHLSSLLCRQDREDWLPASQISCFKGSARS